nr:hypothetical protein [Calothrix sp. FI2-JRJ7]
ELGFGGNRAISSARQERVPRLLYVRWRHAVVHLGYPYLLSGYSNFYRTISTNQSFSDTRKTGGKIIISGR